MKKNLLLITLFFCYAQSTFSQTDQLDPTFGNHGIVKTDIGSFWDYSSGARQVFILPDESIYIFLEEAIVSKRFSNGSLDSSYGFDGYSRSVFLTDPCATLQTDQKIVIAGSFGSGLFGVARINTNGLPDSTFGNNGMQTIGINPRAVAINSEGKIVIAGYSVDDNNTYFGVVRLNTDGNPDNTFNGTGQVITDIVFKLAPDTEDGDSLEFHSAYANTLAIQDDDKIVVGGYAYTGINEDFAIVRYNTDGSMDGTFDDDGIQTTDINSSDDVGNSLAIQSNGKIVLGGSSSEGVVDNYFSIVRYNTNGSLDNSFNGDGKQTANFGSEVQIGNSVAIQSNGKIVLAGYTQNGALNDFSIARFNANGGLDNSFDNDGKVTTDFTTSDDYAGFVAIQSDGKIIVSGHAFTSTPSLQRYALSRYNDDGSLDDSFDFNGKLEGDFNQGNTEFYATAIQTDGKVVAVGQTFNGSEFNFAVARYNNNGSLDSTFSGDGKTITDFTGNSYATAVAIQTDGKIVVTGNSNKQFTIARYKADGNLDNTFSGDGKLTTSLGFADICTSVALQNDGKIVLAGFTFNNSNLDSSFYAIARLNIDGTLDNTFSGDGKQLTDFGFNDFANSVAIQSDGKIVAAGLSNLNGVDNFSLARYNTDGSLDDTFSQDGKQNNTFGSDSYSIQSLAIQNDGSLVVVGKSGSLLGNSSSIAVARYLSNGDLDNSFSDDGFLTTYLGAQSEEGNSVAINADGRIAVGGVNDNTAVVLLYNSNGSLDNTFSNDGIQITNIGVMGSSIRSVAFADNKLYAAGFAQYPGYLGMVARYLLDNGALPVSLLDFKGVLQNKSVFLQWKIATEKNIANFVIERSADGHVFSSINSVTALGAGSFTRNYSVIDEKPLQGINFYRLKMVDIEGKLSYSNIIAVKMNADKRFQLFPNPAKDILFVIASGDNENATIQILDGAGRKMKELKVLLNINTSISININNLLPGIYNMVLRKNGKMEVQQFIKK